MTCAEESWLVPFVAFQEESQKHAENLLLKYIVIIVVFKKRIKTKPYLLDKSRQTQCLRPQRLKVGEVVDLRIRNSF